MDDLNRMLSQEEIDELLVSNFANSNTNTSIESSPVPTGILEPVKVPQLPVATLSSEISTSVKNSQIEQNSDLLEEVKSLSERINKLEASIIMLEQQSKTTPDSANNFLQTTIEQLNKLSDEVSIITEGLRSTAGYNMNKTYTCRQCGSKGIVAIRVRCNQCGDENWWGWWPKKVK